MTLPPNSDSSASAFPCLCDETFVHPRTSRATRQSTLSQFAGAAIQLTFLVRTPGARQSSVLPINLNSRFYFQATVEAQAVVRNTRERTHTPVPPVTQAPGVPCWRYHRQIADMGRAHRRHADLPVDLYSLACVSFYHFLTQLGSVHRRTRGAEQARHLWGPSCCSHAHPFSLPPLLPRPPATTSLLFASKCRLFKYHLNRLHSL